jgi:uncharacterized protein (DUF58 family)
MADAATEPLLDADTVRALERLSLVSLDAIVAGFSGQREGAAGAPGIEFADYRPYAPGDDLRSIDWNVYARLHELLIKVSPAEGHISVDLLIDASRSMDYGEPNKLRHARTLAAALGTVALLRSDAVRAWVLSDGEAQSGELMDAPRMLIPLADEVAALPSGRGTDLPASVRAFRRMEQVTDLAILITDAIVPLDSLREALRELDRTARSVALLHVIDPTEAQPRARGALELRDQETGQRLELTLTDSVTTAYRDRFEAFLSGVMSACDAARARYVRAPTDVSPLDLLADAARLAGLVAL